MRTRIAGTLAALLLLVVPLSAQPLPAGTPLVVQMRGYDQARERLEAMLKTAAPDVGAMAGPLLKMGIDQALKGRKLDGLKKAAPLYFAFADLPSADGGKPDAAFLLPVDKYETLRDSVLSDDEKKNLKPAGDGIEMTTFSGDEEVYFAKADGHLIMAASKLAAQKFAGKGGLLTTLSPEVSSAFTDADLAIYADLKAVNAKYGEALKGFQSIVELGLQQAGTADKNTLEMTKNFYNGMFQGIYDGHAAVLAFDFRPDGLNFRVQMQFAESSGTAKALGVLKPGSLAGVDKLPAGALSYTAMQMDGGMLKTMAPMIYTAFAKDDEKSKAIQAALDELVAAGPTMQFATASMPLTTGVQVHEYKDATKASAAFLKLLQSIPDGNNYQNVPVKSKTIKADALTHKGIKLHHAKFVWDFAKAVEQLPDENLKGAMADAMKKFVGDQLDLWFGTDGKVVIQVIGGDEKSVTAQLDAYLDGKSTVGADAAFALTRKNLPSDAGMVVLMDTAKFTKSMMIYAGAILKNMPGVPFALPEPQGKEGKPAYTGYAISAKPTSVRFDLFFPAKGVAAIRKLFGPVGD
jgi:hypothetical protein